MEATPGRTIPTALVQGRVRRMGGQHAGAADAGAGGDGTANTVEDRGGPILSNVQIVLIFWGSAWASNPPPTLTHQKVESALRSIMSSAYLTGLAQYRGVTAGRIVAVDVNSASDPGATFTNDAVAKMVQNRINAGNVPAPTSGNWFYVALMPVGSSSSDHSDDAGYHYSFSIDGTTAYVAWIENDDTLTSIDSIPDVFAHELAEACSDPLGNAIVVTGNGQTSEIGDVCRSSSISLDGVAVQTYWSGRDQRCIAPVSWLPALCAVSWAHDRLDLFCRGTDSALWHKWWDGNAWGGWESLGGSIVGVPDATAWSADRLDVFARGSDDSLQHWWWDGQGWGGPENLGGQITDAPVGVAWGPNRLDVFARGTDGALWHRWWDGNAWGGWESLAGGIVGRPAVVSWAAGRLDVFARGLDDALWHRWWDGSGWGGWESLGGVMIGVPSVTSWGPNRLDLFVQGADNAVWHLWWDGTQWGTWESLGGSIVALATAVSWGRDRLDVFVQGTDSQVWHKYWNGNGWGPSLTGWEALGGQIVLSPIPCAWGANRLDVFVQGLDRGCYHKWWSGSAWGPSPTDWESLGGTIASY